MTDTYWCESAYLDGAVRSSVVITVTDGRFVTVDPDCAAPPNAARLLGVVLPGLANAHSHAFHRALRSRSQRAGGSFWTWRDLMYRVAGRLDPDRAYRLARATYAEMALAGITTVGEFHYVHHRPDGDRYDDPNVMGAVLLQAAADAGIRITLLDTLYLHGGLGADGYEPIRDEQRRFADRDATAWAERVDALGDGDGRRIGAAIHSVRAVDPASMRAVVEWADRRGAPVHVHVSEQSVENEQSMGALGATPVAVLSGEGVLGERCTVVHATHVSDADITSLAVAGATVCMCPTTEADLADGIGPTTALVASGVPIALGTDSHASIDLLGEARVMELHERLRSGRRGAHPTAALLTAATRTGHRSLGWPDAGRIAPGQRADLVAVTSRSARTAGADREHALEAVVFAATAADVVDVVVDGRRVVAEGRHLTVDVAGELAGAIDDLVAERVP